MDQACGPGEGSVGEKPQVTEREREKVRQDNKRETAKLQDPYWVISVQKM